MVTTAYEKGATLLNYVRVTGFTKDARRVRQRRDGRDDLETGESLHGSGEGRDQCHGPVHRSMCARRPTPRRSR